MSKAENGHGLWTGDAGRDLETAWQATQGDERQVISVRRDLALAEFEELVRSAAQRLRSDTFPGQGWFRAVAYRLSQALVLRDETVLLRAETLLRDLYNEACYSCADKPASHPAEDRSVEPGTEDDRPPWKHVFLGMLLAGLELAAAGVASVEAETAVTFVAGSTIRSGFLIRVAKDPGRSGRALARALGTNGHPLDQAQVSRAARDLWQRGLIERTRVGKEVRWYPTSRGKEVVAQLGDYEEAHEQKATVMAVPPVAAESLDQIAAYVTDAVQRMQPDRIELAGTIEKRKSPRRLVLEHDTAGVGLNGRAHMVAEEVITGNTLIERVASGEAETIGDVIADFGGGLLYTPVNGSSIAG